MVRAVDANGRVIGQSDGVTVYVPADHDDQRRRRGLRPAPETAEIETMTLVQVPPVDGPSDPFDELSLVERARTDRDAFAELYRLYLPRIYAFAYRRCGSRPLAEDVTAATFEEALRSLPSFVAKGGGFGPWLFRIAANEIVDHYRADERARGRKGHRALTLLATPAGGDEDPTCRRAARTTDGSSPPSARSTPATRRRSRCGTWPASPTPRRPRPWARRSRSWPSRSTGPCAPCGGPSTSPSPHPTETCRGGPMNELDRRLREAGQAPVPPPDPAFATMLEERLRAGVLAPEPALRPAPRPARRGAGFPPRP